MKGESGGIRDRMGLIATVGLFFFLLVAGPLFAYSQEPESTSGVDRAMTPQRLSDSFAEVAGKVEPAVVSIDAKGRMPEVASRNRTTPAEPDDILEFFRRQMPRRPASAVGSGFIVDPSGYIITNAHVVENAVRIAIRLDTGEEYLAEVIGADDETDIAVLKIDAGRELPYLKLGDSTQTRVGEWVLAIGSPFGLSRTVTAGIISQVNRETPYATPFQRFLQTDAAINRGNSGGPLVNLNGEVIGVNSQIATSTGDYNGVGFALPSKEAASVYAQIRDEGKVRRGYLGVLLDTVRDEFARVYNMGEQRGAIVTDVRDGDGPAAEAGIKAGDIIVEFDGRSVESATDLIAKVAGTRPDHSVRVAFLRENGNRLERKTAIMTLGERPASRRARSETGPTRLPLEPEKEPKPFGLTVTDLSPQLINSYRLDGQTGIVIREINPESFISDVKLSSGVDALGQGDIITRINRISVKNVEQFAIEAEKLKRGDPVVLHVLTPIAGTRTVQLKIVQFTVQ
jgi:serine protease Do